MWDYLSCIDCFTFTVCREMLVSVDCLVYPDLQVKDSKALRYFHSFFNLISLLCEFSFRFVTQKEKRKKNRLYTSFPQTSFKDDIVLFHVRPDGADWVIPSEELRLCCSQSVCHIGKKERLILSLCACVRVWMCPPQGPDIQRLPVHSLVLGICRDFFPQQRSDTLVQSVNLHRHMCLMSSTWSDRPRQGNTQHPYVL